MNTTNWEYYNPPSPFSRANSPSESDILAPSQYLILNFEHEYDKSESTNKQHLHSLYRRGILTLFLILHLDINELKHGQKYIYLINGPQ